MPQKLRKSDNAQVDGAGDKTVGGEAAVNAENKVKETLLPLSEAQEVPSEGKKGKKAIDCGQFTADDIEEWLDLTRFFDEEHREKTLRRHRRLKALECERQQLLQEEDEYLQRHRSELGIIPAIAKPTARPESKVEQEKRISDPVSIAVDSLAKPSRGQKRSHEDMEEEKSEHTDGKAKSTRTRSLERFKVDPHKSKRSRTYVNATEKEVRQPKKTDKSHRLTRHDLFKDQDESHDPQRVPDTRYFHIRSWSCENVKQAQRDCVWVTQKKNEALLVEAYQTSRRVMNDSKAFQGVAEMGSIPGATEWINPKWTAGVPQASTEAFSLIWHLTREVPHTAVRHLTNPLNQNLPAYIGTDGAEIEARVGKQMLACLYKCLPEGKNVVASAPSIPKK